MGDDSAVLLLPRVPKKLFHKRAKNLRPVSEAGDDTVAASHPSVFHCAVQTGSRKAVGR